MNTAMIIITLIFLAVTKVTLQAKFSKHVCGVVGNVAYNGMMFFAAAVFFTPFLIKNGIDVRTAGAGILMGILSVAFQMFYLAAFSGGKTSLTVIIGNFSMLMPIAVSVICCGESFGAAKILGTALALISCCLTGMKEKTDTSAEENDNRVKWLIFVFAAFLCNGLLAVNQKLYVFENDSPKGFEFVAAAYITATVLSAVVYALLPGFYKNAAKERATFTAKDLLPGLFIGVILGIFQCLNTYANSVIDGTLLFPLYYCGVSVVSLFTGSLIFKEKLSRYGKAGAVIGIAATALLSL